MGSIRAARVQGANYRQICTENECSIGTAHEDVVAELMTVCQKTRADAEELRALLFERSDFCLRGLKAAVMKGDPSSCRSWIRALELQARLGGIIKHPSARPVDDSPTSDLTAMEIAQRVASLVEYAETGEFPRGKIIDVTPVKR